jgi:hypothetical protein
MSHAPKGGQAPDQANSGRQASPCTPGRFIPKTRNRGLTPDESQRHDETSLATAPDGPTRRHLQTPAFLSRGDCFTEAAWGSRSVDASDGLRWPG